MHNGGPLPPRDDADDILVALEPGFIIPASKLHLFKLDLDAINNAASTGEQTSHHP